MLLFLGKGKNLLVSYVKKSLMIRVNHEKNFPEMMEEYERSRSPENSHIIDIGLL